jgi:two-component system nitrogen regulation response regulator GlnG
VAVNTAAIPHELIESELFGHEKGAFTGAVARHVGKFEQAARGTLFLDEIGDMPLEAQTRLLRALQSGRIRRVGGTEEIALDCRIIAATNRDLVPMIASGQFREDLYYRLAVVPIELPPLRERADDVEALSRHFLARAAADGLPRRQLSAGGAALLARQPWRGNVRELRNVIFRLALLARDDVIDEAAIEPLLAGDVPALPRAGEAGLFPGEADGEGIAGDGREDFATALARFIEEARPEAGTSMTRHWPRSSARCFSMRWPRPGEPVARGPASGDQPQYLAQTSGRSGDRTRGCPDHPVRLARQGRAGATK